MSSSFKLKTVNDLLREKFFVPFYQRGYRWTSLQVIELLEDILKFREDSQDSSKDAFYCLQPVVVSKSEKGWVLIDGQQRLTTIHLILTYLEPIMSILNKDKFTLSYETRTESEAFLNNVTESKSKENIDYYHIYQAFKTIETWFKEKGGNTPVNFLTTLTNDDKEGKNVKVIWYEVEEQATEKHIDIFTRINIGKIPLTNAELIKALFLREANFKDTEKIDIKLRQFQIAGEWDNIEYTLQNDSFWYFIYNGNQIYDTRIEYIFDLMKDKSKDEEMYFTFHRFNEDLKDGKNIDVIWLSIKKYFHTIEEWYKDSTLYHYIGFLITNGSSIAELKKLSEEKTKTEFISAIKNLIKIKTDYDLEELAYPDKEIRTILLLFNIQTIVSNSNSIIRFPFDKYKNENWDIEHIRSVASDKPIGNKQRKWLENILEYFIGKHTILDAESQLENLDNVAKEKAGSVLNLLKKEKIIDDEFTDVYNELLSYFNETSDPEDINSMSNLTLLDSATNRSYKNAVFSIKRKTIIKNDMQGTFVPICTKNVFLKSYSSKPDNLLFWKAHDANDYLESIKSTLSNLLTD